MEMKNEKICPACNSAYQITYYQRRAADEPPDEVQYCSNCPLDTTKLSFNYEPTTSISRDGNRSNTIHKRNTSSIDTYRSTSSSSNGNTALRKVGYRYYIKVTGMAAQRCYNQEMENNKILEPSITSTVVLNTINNKQLVKIRTNGVLNQEGHVLLSTHNIAPFVSMNRIAVYKSSTPLSTTTKRLVDAYETILENINGAECSILSTLQNNKSPCILVFFSIENSIIQCDKYACLNVLHQILTRYGTENTIKTFMDPQLINTLYSQSPKAYDWPSAPDKGYKYTWKPDGERFWYIKYGSVWLFCRRLLSGRLIGWKLANTLSATNRAGPVLDVEVMIGFQPILIDILLTDDGTITPPYRSLDDVFNIYYNSKNIDIPIYIREYFDTEKELLETKELLQYPVDGAVGIQDGSMNIIKLKDKKSIELQLQDNGNLTSAEGKVVAKSTLQDIYAAGSIIEIRFVQESGKDKPTITETLIRTDKTKANSYDVCESIMNTMSTIPDDLSRRNAVQWCNAIRQKVHDLASKIVDKGRVILDIGAGDGQAVSDYSTDPTITYVLLEPDIKRCEKLLRRLSEPGKGRCKLFQGAENITRAINLASNRALKYVIVCATVSDILAQQYIIRTLKSSIRCCTATYSISFITSELQQLALQGISIIGCGYMYDAADKNGTLIHRAGVTMKLTDPNIENCDTAVVVWGKDKPYVEPAIRIKDFDEVLYVDLASSLIPVATDNTISLLKDISLNLYTISTTKYI